MKPRRNAYASRYVKRMAPVVSFPLILPVAESVNFPTFDLQGVMPVERLVDLRKKKFSRNAAEALWEERLTGTVRPARVGDSDVLGRAARWGRFALPGAGVFRRVGNKRRRARAGMLTLLLGFDVEGAGLG